MFHASPVQLRAAESLQARLVSTVLAGLAVACAFAAIAASLYAAPQARVLALGVYSVFGTGAGFACIAIRRLLSPAPAVDAASAPIDTAPDTGDATMPRPVVEASIDARPQPALNRAPVVADAAADALQRATEPA